MQSRLRNLKSRFEKDSMTEKYDAIFKDYETDKIIEKVSDHEVEKDLIHYLPHRGVMREDKETTKLRVVFDASCSNGSSPSLNDCLYPGPNLLCKIFDILLRFQSNPIAILSNIKQAFLNIEIAKVHQDFLRLLWFEDPFNPSSELVIYRFLRLVFGLTSSPFILNATIRHHLQKFSSSDSEFVQRFLEDLYVDDCTLGCRSVEEGKEFYEKSMTVLENGGFHLRKWVTNHKMLQDFFDMRKDGSVESNLKKVLGVQWDLDSDEFVFSFVEILKLARSLPMTKRNVLKVGATFFDPLGFISPITTRVKSIFQLLCKDKSDWDDKISGDILSVWEKFLVDLENFTDLRIKRFAFVEVTANIQSVTLHGFCDSSLQSYCGVLYLQIFTSVGIRVYLLAAKTKVAPLKELSIARSELLGCVLLIDLIDQVKCAINGRVMLTDVKCWSDSEVALCWIKGRGKRWKPWVENRVVKIRKVVDDENWSYVEGKNNPADVPTRICEKGDFQKWFEGPVYLYTGDRVGFFDVERQISDCDVLLESSKTSRKIANNPQVLSITAEVDSETSNSYVSSKQNVNILCVVDITRFSFFEKLLNTTAYVLRFIRNIKARIENKNPLLEQCPTAEELEAANAYWIIAEQQVIRESKGYEKMKNSLKLFEAENSILCVKGRFGNTSWDENVKHPMLIGGAERHFTVFLVRYGHAKVVHCGVEATLNWLRTKYWITKGRKTVKQILLKCVICRRFNARVLLPPETPDLPSFRVDGPILKLFTLRGVN